MIMQKRKGGDLGQNGGNGMVNSGQPLALGPAGFTLDQTWSVRKKKRAKNYLNNWKIGVPQVRGSIRGSFQRVKFDTFVIHLGKDVSRQLDIRVLNLGQSSGCRFTFSHIPVVRMWCIRNTLANCLSTNGMHPEGSWFPVPVT